jgi:dTMP kinase
MIAPMRGRFLVLEGVDGCGKTTQARLLALELRRRGRKVTLLREPGGTPIGEAVRALLLDPDRAEMTAWTEVFLFMASRAQLVAERIRPALDRGVTVILDRYYYSTAAYQGAAGGVGLKKILALARSIADFDEPERVFVLDCDPKTAVARSRGRIADRMERKGLDYQRAVRGGFLAMARREPKRFRVVNASASPTDVHQEILREVERVL